MDWTENHNDATDDIYHNNSRNGDWIEFYGNKSWFKIGLAPNEYIVVHK